jgi:hypothetical protein
MKYLRIGPSLVMEITLYTYATMLQNREGNIYSWSMNETTWQQVISVLRQHLYFKLQKEKDFRKSSEFIADVYRGSDFQMIYQLKFLEGRASILIRVGINYFNDMI